MAQAGLAVLHHQRCIGSIFTGERAGSAPRHRPQYHSFTRHPERDISSSNGMEQYSIEGLRQPKRSTWYIMPPPHHASRGLHVGLELYVRPTPGRTHFVEYAPCSLHVRLSPCHTRIHSMLDALHAVCVGHTLALCSIHSMIYSHPMSDSEPSFLESFPPRNFQ